MLDEIIASRNLRAKAVVGFWPAIDPAPMTSLSGMNMEKTNRCNSTFPQTADCQSRRRNTALPRRLCCPRVSGKQDYLGGFVVTAGIGAEELARKYEAEQNDYNALMVKAQADRLAEAFAEHMHEKVRKELWGYQPEEAWQ